jgi:hypothetical protein
MLGGALDAHRIGGGKLRGFAHANDCISMFKRTTSRCTHTFRHRNLSCRGQIWPPVPSDGAARNTNGAGNDLVGGSDRRLCPSYEEEGEGDPHALALWLLAELAEAGNHKKKQAAVRTRLFALDVSLPAAVACLSHVCHLKAPSTSPPATNLRAKQNATPARPSASSSNAAVPRALKTQDAAALKTRHEAAIKTQKDAAARKAQEKTGLKTEDAAADLLLEYLSHLLAFAAGSSKTHFSSDARESSARQRVLYALDSLPSGGGACSSAMQQQVRTRKLRLSEFQAKD